MNDAVSNSMMWVGALMVFTPIIFAGTVLGIWWYLKKKAERQRDRSG